MARELRRVESAESRARELRRVESAESRVHDIRRVEQVMGLPVTIAVRPGEGRSALVDEVYGWLRWVDATFSTYKPDSDISRIGRGELTADQAHPLVRAVLRQAAELTGPTD